jgi:imidazolonepropionase-like amidohydrolase
MSRPRTAADRGRVRRVRAAGLALACGVLNVASAAAVAPAPGLPLHATRQVTFETDRGTWLSVDVAPNGRDLVFDMLGDLYRLDIAGGRARAITRGLAFDSQPAWSPDGAWLAFLSDRAGAENVWVMRADGRDARQVTRNDGPNEFVSPEWSPDGSAVYASLYRADRNAVELWRFDVATGAATELSTRGVNAIGAAPAPDGRHVYYAHRTGSAFQDDVRLPLYTVHRRELASDRTDKVVTHIGSAMRPVVSPDGALLAYAAREDGHTVLRLRNLRTGDDRLLVGPIQHDAQEAVPTRDLLPGYAFTPDGRAIVLTRDGGFVRVNIADGRIEPIPFTAEVALELGPLLRQRLEQDSGPVRARLIEEPRQSPDGTQLAFTALGRVYVMALERAAMPRRLTSSPSGPPEYHPSWSRDGRSLAYVTWTRADGGAIWIAAARTGQARRLTHGDAWFYSDVVFVPGADAVMALRSPARERNETLQEPMWTGRTGGFLRQAELVELSLRDGSARVIAAGPMDGVPQFTTDAARVHLHTDAGLESIARDGTARKVVLRLVGPGYYFSDEPAPASDIRISPDGRHALVLFSQQLYLVPMSAAAEEPIDLNRDDAPARRITTVGADYFAWADEGRTVTWAVGSTFHRVPVARLLEGAPGDARVAAAAAERFDAHVAVPRDTPDGAWVLRGATLLTMRGDEVLRNADLVVERNRIAAVGPSGTLATPPGATVVDARGKYVVPGLIDAHDHVGAIRRNVLQFDDWSLRARLAYGVTSVLDPSSLSIDMFAYADLIDAGQVAGPRLYTTGTAMFSYNRLRSLDDARDLVRRYGEHYRTRNLKQYRIGSRRERQWVAMAAAEQQLMPTSEGAVDMKLGLTQALDGFAGNEHAFGVFPLYRDVVELMARSGTSSVLTLMISHGGPPAGADFIARNPALDDPVIARWFPANARERLFARVPWVAPRDYVYADMAAGAAAIQRAGGVVGIGAHGNYPGIGTHWELQAHVAGGMTPHEALRAATLGSATTIGRARDLGSLEPGKLADFVVLDADPLADVANTLRIHRVVKDGRVWDEETLRK